MTRFLVRRLLLGVFVMWAVTVIVYAIFFIGPGPQAVARTLCGKDCQPTTLALVTRSLHLNEPIYLQYWHFLDGLLHGNLGTSFYSGGESVNTIVKQAFPITVSLAIGAAVLWVVIGVLTGVISAVRPRSFWDRFFTTMALAFYSMPTFVLGLLLLLGLFYELTIHGIKWFPAPSEIYVGFTQNPLTWAHALILPWVTLAAVTAATYTRLTRGSMLDVLGEDYVRTARAKGLSERRVVFRHALRAALTPVVTQFGIDFGTLLGGAVITEQVFGLPGLGYTAVHAIGEQDLPTVIGIVIVAAAAVVTANIIVDILYAVLDPRVRLH